MPLPPRIIFLNRFYWPDETATAQLLADLAEAMAARGRLVTVLTSRPRQSETPRSEARRGVRIERVGGTRSRRFGLLAKALDFATYSCGALFRLMRVARRGDLVITLTDPPLLGIGASLVAWVRGCRSLHWIQDIYPEIAIVVTGRKALAVSRPLRDAAWHRADACVTLSREMADVLAESGVAAEKIHVIPNWPPAGLGPPPAAAIAAKREAWGVAGRFVIAYSGNLGRVHEVTPILDTAEAMQADDQTVFLFVGDGAQRPFLEAEKLRRKLDNVQFLPSQPRGELAASLAAGDVHWVSLRSGCERFVFPSKLSGVAGVGRPVLFLGSPDCEAARLVADHGFGQAFAPEDVAGMVAWLRGLRAHPEECARLGAAALKFSQESDGMDASAEKWERILTGLTAPVGPKALSR